VTVRRYEHSDADDVLDLVASLAGQPYPGELAGGTHASRRRWLTRKTPHASWVGIRDDRVIAHVQVNTPGSDLALVAATHPHTASRPILEIARLMVHPAARRQGTGTRMLETASSWAREQGAHPALVVSEYLRGATASYERAGWVRIGETRSLISQDMLIAYAHPDR
jgi:GNAT superfamily N-acetyltransferase